MISYLCHGTYSINHSDGNSIISLGRRVCVSIRAGRRVCVDVCVRGWQDLKRDNCSVFSNNHRVSLSSASLLLHACPWACICVLRGSTTVVSISRNPTVS